MAVPNEPQHQDLLGRALSVGDCVVYPQANALHIGTVIKLTPKMVKVKKVKVSPSRWYTGEANKYPSDLVKVEGPEVTMFLLKNSH